ncbi:DUF4136 domain-containing protein [Altericroceibacterium xinjiangense]|uniref:DUF4136 domain-containing protein n=1 Tax=Altericroceibacterium xinjiangense TaxID=762261 RepID=UPI000F7F98AF|nr:DUF4136 domain-containing protein [Altericroceibacterium xinjiangense]
MSTQKKSLGRALKMATIPLVLAGLAACATPFNADVSRFATQLPAPQGESFYVVSEDPAEAGGLEFATYARHVAAQMQRLGYAQAATPQDATLLVKFDYGVSNGRERIRSTPGFRDPFFSPWYGYQPFGYSRFGYSGFGMPFGYAPGGAWGYGWHDPFFGGPNINSYTVYTSGIELEIDRAVDGQPLFEGRAEAVSTSNRLQYLVPNLVEAMFTDFPGNSGETVRISVAPERQPVRRSN